VFDRCWQVTSLVIGRMSRINRVMGDLRVVLSEVVMPPSYRMALI